MAETYWDASKEYSRITRSEEYFSLETASRVFLPVSGIGPKISLVGVAHIGDCSYYAELQKILDRADLVLFEATGMEEIHDFEMQGNYTRKHPYHEIALELGLCSQLAVIDYDSERFVRSDFTKEEHLELAAQYLPKKSDLNRHDFILRLAGQINANLLAKQAKPGVTFKQDASLIEKRNNIVFEDLKKVLEAGNESHIAIFYGAEHMADLEMRLSHIGYRPDFEQWHSLATVKLENKRENCEQLAGNDPLFAYCKQINTVLSGLDFFRKSNKFTSMLFYREYSDLPPELCQIIDKEFPSMKTHRYNTTVRWDHENLLIQHQADGLLTNFDKFKFQVDCVNYKCNYGVDFIELFKDEYLLAHDKKDTPKRVTITSGQLQIDFGSDKWHLLVLQPIEYQSKNGKKRIFDKGQQFSINPISLMLLEYATKNKMEILETWFQDLIKSAIPVL
ncbi:MAG: hypothetical protein WCK42_01840 [Myxococcaceae bacterium]